MADISRRDFLKKGSAALAGMIATPTILQASVLNDLAEKKKKTGKKPGDGKLNILGVGIGGRGAANLAEMETENIIGLCDCDWKYAKHVFEKYPQAKAYNDYRKMFDEMLDQADAVMIATADHTHAIIAAEAIALLTEAIEFPETHCARHVTVEGCLVEGETVRNLAY